jgi:oxaloacetate decarboxylase beta subunit
MYEMIIGTFMDSGFGQFHWSNGVMLGVGLLFIYLAVKKGFEPLLLIPIGFGILVGNIPYDVSKMTVGVYDGPVSEHDIAYYRFEIQDVVLDAQEGAATYDRETAIERLIQAGAFEVDPVQVNGRFGLDEEQLLAVLAKSQKITLVPGSLERIVSRPRALQFMADGQAIMVNKHTQMTMGQNQDAPALVKFRQGRSAFVIPQPPPAPQRAADETDASYEARPEVKTYRAAAAAYSALWGWMPDATKGKFAEVWSPKKQDAWNAGVFWMIFRGIEFGFFPPLIFLGIGALTDFGPLISQPKTILLGAAAQLGIFGALFLALFMGFNGKEAASIGIIGGADGPTAIFVCTSLAPDLLGAVALSAYSYMAMVPLIQPPIMRLLTTKKERLIRMEQPHDVPRSLRIMFPVLGFILTAFIAPGALALLGMLFFGNLLRESLVTERLAKTAGAQFIDIVTILLGLSVGAKTSASTFLTFETIKIFILGVIAFGVSTAGGVIFGKIMCYTSGGRVNPLIGSAGVSAVPMAARVVQKVAHEEDPHNFLLMHAMGPNVAGVIGSAVAAGVLLSYFGG